MRALQLLCVSSLLTGCVDVEDDAPELSTSASALTNGYNLCVNNQINAAELSRLDREVRILPLPILPITETRLTAGRAFLIHGSGYETLPAGSYIEAFTVSANLQTQTFKWQQMGVTSNGELLVIPPAPMPSNILVMLQLKFEKPCGGSLITRAWGFNFRQLDPLPPLPLSPGGPPDSLNLTATPTSSSSVQLKWKDAGNGNESGYLVWFRVRGEPVFKLAGSTLTDDTDEPIAPLLAGTEYEFQVAAYDGAMIGRVSQTATAKTPAGAGAGTGVIMPIDPEAQSVIDLSEASFSIITPPLDCARNTNPIKCRFNLTVLDAKFDKNGDGVVGPASAGTNAKIWPLVQVSNSLAAVTGTEAIMGTRFAPGANVVVFGKIEPVTGGGGGRGISSQFVAFHLNVGAAGFTVVDVRGGDFLRGTDALVMAMDATRSSFAGFTLPSGNTLGRIAGSSKLVAHLRGSDRRAVLGATGVTSTYGVTVALTVAPQGAPISFDE